MNDGSGLPNSPAAEVRSKFLVVGLGGSAGSIPAFREFFRNVPQDSGMAYVVILHLSPQYDSHLAEVLQGSASIPVTQVQESVRVEPNHVYVIPPNKSLALREGMLVLSDVSGFEQRRAPVDIFFRTLADALDARAVCVVLSGSGSDGSMGLRRIKENNGLALVQDPDEAEFGEMPRHSIATGLTDFVLPVGEMPARIAAYRDRLRQAPLGLDRGDELDEQALVEILTALRVRTGHDFSNYKRATVLRRVERRMVIHGLRRLSDYAQFMRDRSDEAELLLRELLISVTNFFRDAKVWERVEQTIVPKLLEGKGADDHVRIWVAGCATGEEAYSVAMLVSEAVSPMPSPPEIQIFATDIDEDAIARARNGSYSAADVADVPPERLRRHFLREHESYRVRRELRELVLFAHHNLLKDPPFSHIDFASCRNMLIYLNRTAQERTMEVLHFALEPGGYLLLGAAETTDGSSRLFSIADKEAHLYQSRAVTRVMEMPVPSRPLTSAADARAAPPPADRPEPRGLRLGALDLHQRLLEEYAPPSLVVDERHEIVHLSDRAGRYLEFAAGEASLNLLQVVRPELRIPLRTALFQAARKRSVVAIRGVAVYTAERSELVNLVVRPALREGDPASGYFLVLFEQSRDPVDVEAPPPAASKRAERQLEEELIRVKAQMRVTVEQYEIQAEGAQAANEELQAMNEELRSTAEELETSREELQSLNEELQTLNQELKVKIEEIGHTNDDLRNLMSSTEIGTIFVDRALRVKLFTPRVRDVFHLIPADVGRPLLDINSKLTSDSLGSDLDLVLERLQTVEHEVESRDGCWYLMRLLPYRTAEDRIGGVVLTFVDITERKRAEQALREREERLRLVGWAARIGSFDIDAATRRAIWSRESLELYGLPADRDSVDLGEWLDLLHPDDRNRVAGEVETAAADASRTQLDLEFRIRCANSGEVRWLFGRMHMQRGADGRVTRAIGAQLDITDRKVAEERLRESEQRHRIIVEGARDYAILTTEPDGRMTSWSPGAEAVFGWTAAEAVGQLVDITFTAEDRAAGAPQQERETAREQGSAADVRWHVRKDGSHVFIEGTARPLFDAGGALAGFLKIGQDVTERTRTEAALRESEARLQTVTNLVPDLLWSNDASGYTDWYNDRWLEYTGRPIEEARGFGWIDVIHPDDREADRRNFEQAVASGVPLRQEQRIRGANGEYRWFLVQAQPLRDAGGQIVRWFGAATDIHEQRMAREELEQRVEERTRELAELSGQRQQLLERLVAATEEERQRIARELHDEMGQHLTALRVGLETLRTREGSVQPLKEIVNRLDRSVDRLTLELRPPALDHLGLHGAIISLAEEFSAASGIRVDAHLPGVEGERFGDAVETALYRAIQEALTNVWKHSGAKTVSVIVEREGDALRVIVEDDGKGFDTAGALGGDAARGRFGLLGMRERLALVGGALQVESEPGSGTTLYVRVPLREGPVP